MKKRIFAGILASVMTASMLVGNVFAARTGGIPIDELTFPDRAFRSYIYDELDKGDERGILTEDEINAVTRIYIGHLYNVVDLKGIEVFQNLKYLGVNDDVLERIDISKNTKLEALDIYGSKVESIDLRNNPNLESLSVWKTPMRKLDISANPKLRDLNVCLTGITTINIIHNPILQAVYNNYGKVPAVVGGVLNYWGEPIESIYQGNGEDKELRYTKGSTIITSVPEGLIDINSDIFPDANVRSALAREVDLDGDVLLSADEIARAKYLNVVDRDRVTNSIAGIERLTNLENLYIDNASISSFDGSPFPNLKILQIHRTPQLQAVDVSNNPNLDMLSITETGLSSIDVSHNPELRKLSVYINNITSLDISANPLLLNVYDTGTQFEVDQDGVHYYTHRIRQDDDTLGYDYGTEIITEKRVEPSTPITPSTPSSPSTPSAPVAPAPQQTAETGVAGFVERLYTVALGRSSEPTGKANWIAAIKNGETGADAAKGFLFSDEFLNKNMSNSDFVTILYRVFFDRQPDAAGHAAWVAVLERGESKQDVILGFINSTEWANVCLKYGIRSGGTGTANITIEPNDDIIAFATRLYTTCLKRTPDQNGLRAWALQLANLRDTGTNAAHGFFFSDEMNNNPVSNEEFVTRLYLTFMDRNPDTAGFNAWVGQLNSGVSREEVFQGFAQSREFGEICARYGIIR